MTPQPPAQAAIDPHSVALLLPTVRLPAKLCPPEATARRRAVLDLAAAMPQARMDELALAVRPGLGDELVLGTAAQLVVKGFAKSWRKHPMQRETSNPGLLRNGNPRGNPNVAGRCGALTRAGCACRSSAMANGRCRMHGGASTGVQTDAGRARIGAARTVHGWYQTEAQAALHRYDGMMRELRQALRLLDQGDEVGALELLLNGR